MILAKPLPSFDAAAPAVLTLRYPMALAMKPFEAMFWALGAIALIGLAILMVGTWMLSRGLTRPIIAAGPGRAAAAERRARRSRGHLLR